MAVNDSFFNWQTKSNDPAYNRCSPNLRQLGDELGKRFAMTDLGCYGERAVRAGTVPSSHSHGAAIDRRYDTAGRYRTLAEILPWLIDNSLELHVSAIHDYVGCRIWHAGRVTGGDPRFDWWKAQSPNPATGMGMAWAKYLHIETTLAGWGDNTPIPNRLVPIAPPTPIPVPSPAPGGFMHATVRQGDENADVYALQLFARKVAGNTDIVVDGRFGPITDQAVRLIQAWYGLDVDGIAGPNTWARIDLVVNS